MNDSRNQRGDWTGKEFEEIKQAEKISSLGNYVNSQPL